MISDPVGNEKRTPKGWEHREFIAESYDETASPAKVSDMLFSKEGLRICEEQVRIILRKMGRKLNPQWSNVNRWKTTPFYFGNTRKHREGWKDRKHREGWKDKKK